jgi:hypothetical protein
MGQRARAASVRNEARESVPFVEALMQVWDITKEVRTSGVLNRGQRLIFSIRNCDWQLLECVYHTHSGGIVHRFAGLKMPALLYAHQAL